MKKLLSLILAFCLCATVTPIGAFNLVARAETYGNLTYTITSGEVTITDCTDDAISETIPSEIGGYPVTSIASSAFEGCVELTEVIIPDTMYSINNYAFKDCTKLENILIPDSVTKIGEDVFEGSAYYNDESNWEDDVLYNGNHLIKAKDTIISHTIKSSTKTVAKSAFKGCTTLETITLPFIGGSRSENKYLGYIFGVNMHTNASNSLKNVVLTSACLEIPDNGFSGCKSIVDVEIANSVTSIGNSAFKDCTTLPEITIPNGVTSIGDSTFQACITLPEITIPNCVTSIGDSAFKNCVALETVTIPDSVTKIGEDVFEGSAYYNDESNWEDDVLYNGNHLIKAKDTIISHTIKSSTKTVAKSAFKDCTTLETITLPFIGGSRSENKYLGYIFGVNMHTNASNSLKNVVLTSACLEIPDNGFSGCKSIVDVEIANSVTSIGDFAFQSCKALSKIVIPNSITSIGNSAFKDCTTLETITLPFIGGSRSENKYLGYIFGVNMHTNASNSLKNVVLSSACLEIPDNAFSGCKSIVDVEIANSVTSIGNSAFKDCTTLLEITIPNGATSIGDSTFQACNALTSVTIPNSVTSIGNSAFQACITLPEITIPNSVTSIGDSAFKSCSALTNVNIPDSVTSIGDAAFYNCAKLKTATLSNNATSLGDYSFAECSDLEGIVIPDSITELGESAFKGCDSLTNITFGSGISEISYFAFSYCTSLATVTIPKTVKTIGYRSFYDCQSIETITIEDGVTKIDNGAFEYCTALKTVNIPRSVKDIGWYAFTNCNALENISVNTENENFTSVDGVLFSKDKSVLVIYPKSKSNEKYTIPNTVKEVEGFAFDNVTSLKDIIIPKSITSINTRAFSNCGLKNVFYAGNKSDWHSIDFSYGNSMLTTANIHYESTDHNHKNTITKATLSKNGSIVYKCEACKKINSVTTIYYPKTIKLSTTTYTYNGKTKKPSVKVTDSNGKTISSSNYTVSYAGDRKYPGKYKVTVKFKGNYEGTKTLYFTVKPKKASLSSVKSTAKKKMTVKWSKQSGVTGYQVVYATNSKFTKGKKTVTVKGSSSKSKTIKSLKSKKTYYVKVRAYKTIDGKKVYGAFSKYKKVKVK